MTKKRVSAFVGSDLDLVLRARGIQTLVLTGIATSGVVLSTLRAAADMDYELIVLEDCCADGDPQGWAGVHETSMLAALLVALAVAGAVFAIAVALVSRGWRLKP